MIAYMCQSVEEHQTDLTGYLQPMICAETENYAGRQKQPFAEPYHAEHGQNQLECTNSDATEGQ